MQTVKVDTFWYNISPLDIMNPLAKLYFSALQSMDTYITSSEELRKAKRI